MNLTITETPAFTKLIAAYADEDYRALQNVLLNDPLRGKVIPGGGGIRKIRMAIKGKGKSGGARVFYYLYKEDDNIFMLFVIEKGTQSDLSKEQLKKLAELI